MARRALLTLLVALLLPAPSSAGVMAAQAAIPPEGEPTLEESSEPAPAPDETLSEPVSAPDEPLPIFSPPESTDAPQAVATSPLRWTPRASGEFTYGALLANPGVTARLAQSAGFTHMWSYVRWKQVEPSRGKFLFNTKNRWGQTTANDLTNVLNAANRVGLNFVLRIVDPPDWAGGQVYRIDPSDLEDYVYAAVRYSRGTISHVEVFNEVNRPHEWGTAPVDPGAYVKLLAAAYRGARRADPSVRVVTASPAARTGGQDGSMEDVDWLEALYRAGGRDSFDLLGMHPYVGSLPVESDPSCTPLCFRTLELWRAVMERNGDSGKKAFISETGTLEQGSSDLGAFNWMKLPSDKRGEYLVKALQLANANYPWIAGAMVFNLDYATTAWNPPSAPHYWFSLLNADRSPRPAYTAFKQARQNGTLP